MNSKKIFISIFIIIAIVFMTANVFAYTTKGPIPSLANTNKGQIFNLKINEIKYTKYPEPIKIPEIGNKTYCGHIDIKTSTMTGNSRNLALSILISRPFNDKSIYPKYIEEIYLSGLEGKSQFVSRENKKLWLYSPSSNSTDHKIYLYEEELCSSETLDVYIFKPYYPFLSRAVNTGLSSFYGVVFPVLNLINLYNFTSDSVFEDYQEKVYVHHYKRALLNQGYVVSAFDLKRDASKLYNINNTENSRDGDAYFYNVDYAYGIVPVTGSSTQSPSTPNSSLQSANQNTTGIPCDDSFRTATELGYQASWSYKCTDDKTGYYKCENGVSHGPYTFSRTSRLKPLICTSESTETTESTTTTETSQNKVVLTIENNTNISDINYSLDNTNWYSTKKIDFPKSFILGNKTNNKTINVDLDMFTEGTIYAIVSTVDKKTEIDNELKTIYQTGNFTGYNLQTASNVFEINNTLSLSKLQYTLDNTKKVKLNISNNITNGDLVIIFMQKSQDNSKVNLVYSNLYVLDEKEQSQYYLCEINKKIVSFYCRGHICNLNISCMKTNRWDFDNGLFVGLTPRAVETATPTPTGPQEVQSPVSSGNCSIDTQTTVEEYITCLRNNIETVNLTRSYALVVGGVQQGSAVVGNTLINNKYNTNRLCETSQSFNDAVFTGAKNANLTEEETAQLWSRLASESGCNSGVGCGDYCDSHGIAQINMTGWNNSSSYNLIKPYLVTINSSKYDTFAKFQSRLSNVTTDITSSVEISIAINKYHKSVILNKSRNTTKPFTDLLDKTYDHNDAIDMQFATAYTYTGVAYADHFSDGIKVGNTRYQGVVYPALHKMGYYLTYKRMIYNCHKTVTTNAFVTSYKTKYQGSYCK